MASNADIVSIWCLHHGFLTVVTGLTDVAIKEKGNSGMSTWKNEMIYTP